MNGVILLPVFCVDCGAVAVIALNDPQGWTHSGEEYHCPECSDDE